MNTTPWQLGEPRRGGVFPSGLLTFALRPLQVAVRMTPLLFLGTLLIFLFRPPDVDFYELDRFGFLLLVAACLFRAVLLRKSLWPSVPLIWPMLLLSLLAVITTLGQPYDSQTWSLFAAKFGVPYTLYYLAGLTFDTPESLHTLEIFLLFVLAYLSFTAIVQLWGWDALVFPRYILDPSIGIHLDRARGPFLQAVANGVTLSLLGLVALNKVCRGQLRGAIAVLILSALPIAILATMTRAVWLSFAGSVAWLGLSQRGILRKASVALIGVTALGLLVSFSTSKSESALLDRAEEQGPINIRLAVYRAALGMASEKPILGWGVNQMPQEVVRRVEGYRLEAYWAHNSYLEILVENGIVGLALYLSIAVGLFRVGREKPTSNRWPGTLAGPKFRRLWPVLVCIYLFNACFVVMNYQFVNALVFTLAGILAAQQPAPQRTLHARVIAAAR
jgi:putative inorganic carbon (HCO3(-)) transporter